MYGGKVQLIEDTGSILRICNNAVTHAGPSQGLKIRGGAHSQIWLKNVQKVHVLRFLKFFFSDSVWYWRLEISDKTGPLYAQCTVVFIEPEQTQLFSADFIR